MATTPPSRKRAAPKKAPSTSKTPAAPKKPASAAVPVKAQPDWERIELDYRAGIKTLRQIADEHGITHGAINKRARRNGWERDLSHRGIRSQEPVRLVEADEMSKAGFVYVIYMEDSAKERFYKIGMASSFTARFSTHQCASPFDLCVACAYFVGNMRAEESYLHTEFADNRIRGEWFRLSGDDLELIAKRSKLV